MSEGEVIDVPAVREPQSIVRAAPGDVAVAFDEYRKIQSTLDRAMPDCIMEIRGKQFRKKAYWRGIATAFNLRLTLVSEERVESPNDWGWLATYRAEAGNGRSCDGDGACFASEKHVYVYDRGQRTDEVDEAASAANASEHNVRAHAHTRAKNRAISDLVGFGEVSAEEINDVGQRTSPPDRGASRDSGGRGVGDGLGPNGTWPIGKYKGKELSGLPSDFLVWAVGKMGDKPKLQAAAQAEIDRRRDEALGKDEPPPPGDDDAPF